MYKETILAAVQPWSLSRKLETSKAIVNNGVGILPWRRVDHVKIGLLYYFTYPNCTI